ncbi:hypothetical protein EXIGLDRAFT_649451 [Exidia glandulosa HHB12029]|uniref:Sfi1 spindle body domain-containing protein n=1 Tax=Exidia glandulosa HHB12029 TaxID=1314781 RepID=A0A165GAC2_EXIGL|nr:hypothetical protein EXIGLDRAFT_649451 [Exidia glandulosa HHB12029]
MRKCWDTWRAGFLWIRNTGDQVHAAHGELVVHKCLLEWHKSYLRKQSLMERAAQIDDRNLLRRAMHAWVARCQDNLLRKMRVQEWRTDMRRRMAAVQSARRLRLMAQAFVTWHVIHLGLVWERHQNYTVAKNALSAWRRHAQAKIAHLESIASQCTEILNHGRLTHFFERWRLERELQSERQQFEEGTGRRLLRKSIHIWREHTASRHEQRRADTVRRRAVLSSAFSKWKAALARNRSREHRAVRWSARSDKLLVISYAYCWIAREREQLLGRVRDARTTREYLGRWMAKLRRKRELEAHADAVARVHAAPLLRGTLAWWRTKLQKQQHAERFYAEYHAVNLMIRAFGKWERTLASRLQAEQQALHLRHQFLARRCLRRWREAVKKRKLRAAWRAMKRRHTQAWFERWLNMAQMNRVSRVLGDRRAMRSALSIWIGRVIALKERELDVQENRDRQLVTFVVDRWRDRFDKIQEDASLLENFVLIRQQKDMRDSFIRWNDAMHQRRYLRQAEEDIADSVALTTVWTFWDKWRERFLEQRLQPLERQFKLQMQTNLRFFFFSRWYSKTSILPAIHFQVTSTKRRTWEKWRAAMGPALQMKQARELDRRTVLIKGFEKWQASYKAALRRRATAKRDWWLPTLHGSSMLSARPSPAAVSPFASSSSPATRFPVPPRRTPPSPSPPARPLTSLPLRPSLSDHIVNTPRRPRSMTAASSGSRPPAVTPTVFSRPLSRVGGIAASVTATSDSDGLWKQLRSERGLRGTRTDSRGGSPAP